MLLLVIFALLPYVNSLRTGFTFDDEFQIRTNPSVTGGMDMLQIFSSSLSPGSIYRPFTVLTFALNEKLAPGLAAPFHAANALLHAVVTILVYLLAWRLFNSTRAAFIGAALFAVHPIHTEAVTSLVGRAEVLAALCGLVALLSAARADVAVRHDSKVGLQMLSVAFFLLALLSKESALTILPLIPLFRIAVRRESFRSGLWREFRSLDWLPYALGATAFVVLRSAVVHDVELTPLDNLLVFVPLDVRIRSAFGVLWDYFGLLNVPLVLAADYSYNQVPAVTSWWALHFWAGVVVTAVPTVICLRRRWDGVSFATTFPFVTIALTANLLFPIGTVKAERLLYLPSVGWAILIGLAFDTLLRRQAYRSIVVALLCTVVLAFSARTWVRNWDWKDNPTLYRSMVRSAPDSAKAHYNFGVVLQDAGLIDDAAAEFHRALEIYRWAEGAALGIGLGFEKRGRAEEAVAWFKQALQITPNLSEGHVSLCRVLVNSARFGEAAGACRQGLRYRPADPALLRGLGISLVGAGATSEGVGLLRRALALNPQDEELRAYLMQLQEAPSGRQTQEVASQ